MGESSGQIYRLGDQVKVKVLSVNLNDKQIDFELVGSQRAPRGKGKTAKQRLVEEAKKQARGKGKKAKAMVEPTVRPDGSTEQPKKGKKSKAQKARKSKARANKNKSRGKKK